MSKHLKELREGIDEIDRKILSLLNERARLVIEIGRIKTREKRDYYSPEREREIYERLVSLNTGPIPNSAIKNIFREIMSASLSLEKPLKIAFLGPYATFTHEAAMRHFGLSGEFIPKDEIADVFDEVEKGKADFGVVPVENTTEGAVDHTLDMFITSNLRICAEIMLEISLALMNRTGKLGDIRKVSSNSHAIAQCSRWLKKHLPGVAVVDTASTALAAQKAAQDPSIGAIASEAAATTYDLKIVERKIEDHQDNFTRFLVIGRKGAAKTGSDKTSLLFAIKDAPGALYRILRPFAQRNINLTKIESRPMKTKAWEYVFFLDMEGHITDKRIKQAIEKLEEQCSFIKILGSYPKSQ